MAHVVIPAWKDEIVQRPATVIESSEQSLAGKLNELELHRSLGSLLHHDSTFPDTPAGHNVTNANFDHIATAQLAVDRKVKESSIPKATVLVKPETKGPYLLRFECALCAQRSTLVPWTKFVKRWI